MFAPGVGVPENPATGSAAAAFPAVLHRFDTLPEGTSEFTIEQGIEMGRPGEIKLEIEVANRKLKRVRIGGFACLVARGKLSLKPSRRGDAAQLRGTPARANCRGMIRPEAGCPISVNQALFQWLRRLVELIVQADANRMIRVVERRRSVPLRCKSGRSIGI